MKVASTKLANPEWEALQNKCNEKGVTIAEYLRGLIRIDSESTPIHEEGQPSCEKEPVMANGKRSEPPASSLAWLTGKRPAATSNTQSESQTPMADMREQVRKQDLAIRDLVSQMKEMVTGVSEQKKEYERAIQLQRTHSKYSCQALGDIWKTKCTFGS